jgi:hypothetical protein
LTSGFASGDRPSTRWLATALATFLAGCGGCSVQKQSGEKGPAGEVSPPQERVRPVYETTGPADPLAARFCKALYALPEEQRAKCCASPPGVVLTDACVGVLSTALRSKAVVLETVPLEACEVALQQAYAGCEWVGAFGPTFPKECQGLFTGHLALGEECRSSLECSGRLLCAGTGPTDLGRCSPSGEKGATCSTAVDALAVYTRQDVDRSHPQCLGLCRRHQCEAALPAGTLCETSQQCPMDQRCAGGRCAEGLAAVGQACSGGDCAMGLRCLQGKCFLPLGTGVDCSSDFECRGGCLAAGGARRCGMRCDLR